MSQHDYVLDNQDGASFRQDINAVLQAIASLNSGATEPATPYAYMLWQDTAAGVLKQRNAANTGWATLFSVENGSITTAKIADAAVTAAKLAEPFTLGTSVNSTSGTSIDFTGIPSWAKRITINFSGVSTNGSSPMIVRIGNNTPETTGYTCGTFGAGETAVLPTVSETGGFAVTNINSATSFWHGSVILSLLDATTRTWAANGNVYRFDSGSSGAVVCSMAGSKAAASAINMIRITTIGAINSFDAGKINILYE